MTNDDKETIKTALYSARGAIKILGFHMTSGIGAEGKQDVLNQINEALKVLDKT